MEMISNSTDIHFDTYTQDMHIHVLLTSSLLHEPKSEKISTNIYMLISREILKYEHAKEFKIIVSFV